MRSELFANMLREPEALSEDDFEMVLQTGVAHMFQLDYAEAVEVFEAIEVALDKAERTTGERWAGIRRDAKTLKEISLWRRGFDIEFTDEMAGMAARIAPDMSDLARQRLGYDLRRPFAAVEAFGQSSDYFAMAGNEAAATEARAQIRKIAKPRE